MPLHRCLPSLILQMFLYMHMHDALTHANPDDSKGFNLLKLRVMQEATAGDFLPVSSHTFTVLSPTPSF